MAKRIALWFTFVVVVAGVGAIAGVLYPYTELIFGDHTSSSQRSRHTETVLNDDAQAVQTRAWIGAGYGAGMALLVIGVRAYRRRREA